MRRRQLAAALLLAAAGTGWCAAAPIAEMPEVKAFAAEVEERHGIDSGWIMRVLGDARRRQSILDAFSRPAEAKPWHAYREIFLTRRRIRGGAAFIRAHAEDLRRAEARYGVPPEIITAIIGVETSYGRFTGNFKVVDALVTLAFFAPRRRAFFRGELAQYLVMLDEENLSSTEVEGSYAGAIGFAQFIPSSYRAYAIDFDGDGVRDLSGSMIDAIGSVANYLREHGWRVGEPVSAPLAASEPRVADSLVQGMRLAHTWGDLARAGLRPAGDAPPPDADTPVALVRLEGLEGPEYWVGFRNFHVITRYNRSVRYAMAVHQLAVAIRRHAG